MDKKVILDQIQIAVKEWKESEHNVISLNLIPEVLEYEKEIRDFCNQNDLSLEVFGNHINLIGRRKRGVMLVFDDYKQKIIGERRTDWEYYK